MLDTSTITAGTNAPKKLRGKPFAKGPDPRRGVSPGRPTDDFVAHMRSLASSEETLRELCLILKDHNHPHFVKALTFCADRGYGKPTQPIDLTSNGETLTEILLKGRERVARMRRENEGDRE